MGSLAVITPPTVPMPDAGRLRNTNAITYPELVFYFLQSCFQTRQGIPPVAET
jgi:hypothetical protein